MSSKVGSELRFGSEMVRADDDLDDDDEDDDDDNDGDAKDDDDDYIYKYVPAPLRSIFATFSYFCILGLFFREFFC